MDAGIRAILDSVKEFYSDRELTPEEAKTLDESASRPIAKIPVRDLPRRPIMG